MTARDEWSEVRPHRRSRKPRSDGQRVVSIGSLYREQSTRANNRVPYVRLSGHWLEQLGFTCGAQLLIASEQGKLVLTIAPPEPVQEPIRLAPHRRAASGRRAPRPRPHLALAFLRRRVASLRSATE